MQQATAWQTAPEGAHATPEFLQDREVLSRPRILRGIDNAQALARIKIWRDGDKGFDALILRGDPLPMALRRIALAHWTRGNPRLAAIMLATAVALDATSAELWLDLGGALRAMPEPDQARLAFEHSLALDATPARAWLSLALVANELGDRRAAEAAFAAALERDETLGDAAFGLALVAFDERRYVEAAAWFKRAIELNAGGPIARVGLGQSLFFVGEFVGAAEHLLAVADMDPNLRPRAALSRYLAELIAGDLAEAERRYAETLGGVADYEAVARKAFQILSGYGHRDAALRLAAARLRPERDIELKYLVAAVAGEALERAPADYIAAHFDAFADQFDSQLVGVLGYRTPDDLMDLVEASGRKPTRALDLGCGTGLAAARLRPDRRRLIGVDLAPRMLAKAHERELYDELVEAEILSYLRKTKERFDLVFVADTLVYLGDLAPFFAAAARVTTAGALVAFNVETAEGAPYRVLPSGRFAHDVTALPQMAAPWFRVMASRRSILRVEGNRKVEGALILMERRGARLRVKGSRSGLPTLAA